MKPPAFRYHDPREVTEAVGLLAKCENAKLLAGGQSLMPMLNMRYVLPDHVIDLNRIGALSYIREEKGALEIGAMTRQRDIEFSGVISGSCPLMAEAIRQVGHRQTRNRGTLGGSLCHLDPSAELVSVAAAQDAMVRVAGPKGTREIAFADFPAGYMTPAIAPDELVTSVGFPAWPKGHGYAFMEFARRRGDFAIVSAAALMTLDANGKVARVSLTIGGASSASLRMRKAEESLLGEKAGEGVFRAAAESCRDIDAVGDVHAPASYRRQLAAVLARRALLLAHSRIGGRP